MSGWTQHFYRHKTHGLREVINPEYWRDAGNLGMGDTITCYLGRIGERTIVTLGVLRRTTQPRGVEVSIISRSKETPVDPAHFEDAAA
jgi:hypothetical protein